ncbi:sensor histidine kinase [Roseivirga misakiensis]|uniref:Histidine kinase domain-containing protein n=1 Tax=Roseivirga misakiensis TaxID=1563681 RepID=A0A1E5T357_9BACT|nr:sensor histidine kinase [Roseivirga misakiensis]OEK05786.1 hypothetical protein BFP71_06610 [Roseivirga misakiensis]
MLLSLLLGLFQLVQQDLPTPQVINTQNGLSNNIVYETYQDKSGYLWIATDNGLNRYDGYDFKTFYYNSEDSTTISSNIVRTVLEDSTGNLWVGTFDGLNLYNPKTESFRRFKNDKNIPNGRLDIQHMTIDGKGKIWINSLRTIGWFDTNTLEFGFTDPNYPASTMAVDNMDRVWSSSKTGTIDLIEADGKGFIQKAAFHITKKQPLYWGVYSETLWVNEINFQDKLNVKTSVLPKLPNAAFARELLETDSNTLWIGTEIGLFIYKKREDQLTEIKLGNATTLTSAIRSIDMDKNGGIWVGTLGGLFHFDAFQKPFNHLDIVRGAGDVIMGLEEIDGKIYTNALGNGLYEYDLRTGNSRKLSFKGNPPVGFDFIWSIKSVPESNYPLWLATDAGLLLYNPENGLWKDSKLHVSNKPINPSFSIYLTDRDFNWVSAQEGVHQVRKKDGKILKTLPLFDYTKESIIQDLTQIGSQLFIATEGVGTIIYNVKTEAISRLSDVVPDATSIASTPTWQLFKDDKTLWLATNRGLFSYHTISGAFNSFNEHSSLNNRIIFSIEKDENDVFWMGTERGLISYDRRSETVYNYKKNDGLENIEFNRKSVKKSTDGILYFGGVNGITVFDPNRIQQNTVIPKVYIKNLAVTTKDSTYNLPINDLESVVLPWNGNTIQLEFVAINFTNPDQNQYKHQLVGYDPDWVKQENSRLARYVRLPPGSYEFNVLGANNDGLWNPIPAQFSIEILPPFWQTWWFRTLVLLTIITMLWALYRYRVKKLLEVERMRLRIAGDLHDEVGSGLSGIALTGDLLQRQLQNGGAKPELVERITKNARNLASSLDAIVWLIDPNKESLGDLLIKTRAVGSELLNQPILEVDDRLSDNDRLKPLSADQKRHLFLFMKEGFNNIAKHAKAKQVSLTVESRENELHLRLSDNGVGFDTSLIDPGHGLGSLSNRAELLKAEFSIKSTLGKGTEIGLKMKLP